MMKFNEFKQLVEGLSNHYKVEIHASGVVRVLYRTRYSLTVLITIGDRFRVLIPSVSQKYGDRYINLEPYPFSHKLFMYAAELAMTPRNKRMEEPRFQVHLIPSVTGYLNKKIMEPGGSYVIEVSSNFEDNDERGHRWQTVFTVPEYNQIREKLLADGYFIPIYDPDKTKIFIPVYRIGD